MLRREEIIKNHDLSTKPGRETSVNNERVKRSERVIRWRRRDMKLEVTGPEQETEDETERCAPADGGGPAQGEEERH